MNERPPSKLRLTTRGVVFTLTGIFIGIPLLTCLWIEYSVSCDLSQRLAKVQQSREKLRQSTHVARELKEQYAKERTQAYWHELHIIDLLDQCRHIRDLPNIQTDFIICHRLMNEPDNESYWIVVPEGDHELHLRTTEIEGKSITSEQVFSYSLLANSGYKLRLKIPGPPYKSPGPGGAPDLERTPIVLTLESNNPEFKAIEETLPIRFFRRVATQHLHSNSQLTNLVLRFPSEFYGEWLQFRGSGIVFPEPDDIPTSKTAHLSRFAWHLNRDNRSTPSNSLVMSIEVSSDAPICAAPFSFTKPEDKSKFQPYSGQGRFLLIDEP